MPGVTVFCNPSGLPTAMMASPTSTRPLRSRRSGSVPSRSGTRTTAISVSVPMPITSPVSSRASEVVTLTVLDPATTWALVIISPLALYRKPDPRPLSLWMVTTFFWMRKIMSFSAAALPAAVPSGGETASSGSMPIWRGMYRAAPRPSPLPQAERLPPQRPQVASSASWRSLLSYFSRRLIDIPSRASNRYGRLALDRSVLFGEGGASSRLDDPSARNGYRAGADLHPFRILEDIEEPDGADAPGRLALQPAGNDGAAFLAYGSVQLDDVECIRLILPLLQIGHLHGRIQPLALLLLVFFLLFVDPGRHILKLRRVPRMADRLVHSGAGGREVLLPQQLLRLVDAHLDHAVQNALTQLRRPGSLESAQPLEPLRHFPDRAQTVQLARHLLHGQPCPRSRQLVADRIEQLLVAAAQRRLRLAQPAFRLLQAALVEQQPRRLDVIVELGRLTDDVDILGNAGIAGPGSRRELEQLLGIPVLPRLGFLFRLYMPGTHLGVDLPVMDEDGKHGQTADQQSSSRQHP
ncbi:hypothetical protein BN871_AV_00040 [Paenibacillus sp. P22]|nr:hypothetical protein BN871_AV_00040 [Paenibacillus sp. P22]